MTTPTLKSALPAGSILSQNVDADFSDYIAGRTMTQRIVLAVVQVGAVHASTQEKGRSNKATYETVHAVEITDPHEIDQMRHRLTQLRADRGFAVHQPALFDLSDTEQAESLIDLIKEWASEQDIAIADLDQQWVTYFGGTETANSQTIQASRAPLQLREFAFHVGAIAEADPTAADEAPPVLFSGDTSEPVDDEPEDVA